MTFTTEELFVVVCGGKWTSEDLHSLHDNVEEADHEARKKVSEALKAGYDRIKYRVTTLDDYLVDFGHEREDLGRRHAGDF